ncbi:MAG: capsule biosynthesis protein [Marinovum sp.]|nr:capsule biosynthesis protein [Marinovum sp.]
MTMKHKIEKYRIKGLASQLAQRGNQEDNDETTKLQPTLRNSANKLETAVVQKTQNPANQDLEAVQQEGLSARQLRMARRTAQKHGLPFETDHEAVLKLRMQGIDPFERVNVLDIPAQANLTSQDAKAQLPQKSVVSKVPAVLTKQPDLNPAAKRADEIMALQKDMIRRRRRNILMLLLRLTAFIFLPTLMSGYYFASLATPMYFSKSAFQIIKADSGTGAAGGLLSGTQFATTPDAIAVQSYLESKEAMLRLDRDVGFKAHFSDSFIDVLQRLPENASNETAYKIYKKRIKLGFDPTEGVVNMEVISADPEVSVEFSRALITYAEEKVDGLSQRKKKNQLSDAKESLQSAIDERRKAQEALVKLQQSTLLDPQAYATSLRVQISTLEQQILSKELKLEALLDNLRPNESRVSGVRADIRRLRQAKTDTEETMQAPTENGMTLAELLSRIQVSMADVATRDMMFQSSLEHLRATESDATSQSTYLTLAVEPVKAESASHPHAFEDTLTVLLILSGIYLLISITASILREQVN